jgi:cytochrome c peroxidase
VRTALLPRSRTSLENLATSIDEGVLVLKAVLAGALIVTLGIFAEGAACIAADVGKNSAIPKTIPRIDTTADTSGKLASYQPGGATTTARNAFFQSLGTNGRSCFSCHRPQDGWSISAADATARFKTTRGKDPIFSLNDGATCPSADVSATAAMKRAYQLLLGQGLFRISLPMPPAEILQFSITSVSDPYNCNTDPTFGLHSPTTGMLSVYRRPLPATNLKFDSTLMWDGREPSLQNQAIDATIIHAQSGGPPEADELKQIVDFESGIFTAQSNFKGANDLTSNGVNGGPAALSMQPFFIGINDPFSGNPMGTPFDSNIFNLFEAWATDAVRGASRAARESIARGERIFNTTSFTISGVPGLNDAVGQASITGTCGTCHDTPNVGNHSIDASMNIGTSDLSRVNPALPLPSFTIHCDTGPLAGQTYLSFDPGRALITGKCEDIGKVKVPSLRGLAARAPYFHNGSAADVEAVISFYQRRFFTFSLTSQETTDLTNFLNSL